MAHLFAHYFVHPGSVGNRAECEAVFARIDLELQALYRDEQIEGSRLLIVESATDAEDRLVWCEFEKVTSGQFPFVCAILQPLHEDNIDLDRRMSEWEFERCTDYGGS